MKHNKIQTPRLYELDLLKAVAIVSPPGLRNGGQNENKLQRMHRNRATKLNDTSDF
jgi:hypothetical protein